MKTNEGKMQFNYIVGRNNGITIIALTITIIILLILAGISLQMVLGDNGLVKQTMGAKEENRAAAVEEIVSLWKQNVKIDKNYNKSKKIKSMNKVVDELIEAKLLTLNEKYMILGNESLGTVGEYKITIGSKTIDFYIEEYMGRKAGLYDANGDIKTWNELIEEGYITVVNGTITSCKKDKEGELVVPNVIRKIDSSVFSGYTKLTGIEIPNTVTEIGANAFVGCTGLTQFVIEDSIETIGMLAFKNCTGIKEIVVKCSDFTIDVRK